MRSLAEIRERADVELRRNPTITVYTFRNGVEHRRPANPWVRMAGLFDGIGQALVAIKPVLNGLDKSMRDLAAKLQEPGAWHGGWP